MTRTLRGFDPDRFSAQAQRIYDSLDLQPDRGRLIVGNAPLPVTMHGFSDSVVPIGSVPIHPFYGKPYSTVVADFTSERGNILANIEADRSGLGPSYVTLLGRGINHRRTEYKGSSHLSSLLREHAESLNHPDTLRDAVVERWRHAPDSEIVGARFDNQHGAMTGSMNPHRGFHFTPSPVQWWVST